jgi:undecaprenyl diphosphate synthase
MMPATSRTVPLTEAPDPTTGERSTPPVHVGIIMDGNGRWATARGQPRIAGHREGARAVRRTIEAAISHEVRWLTLYAFSSENWRRPAGEVLDLTGLLRQYLRSEIAELRANGIRLRIIGDPTRFGAEMHDDLQEAIRSTAVNTRLNLTVALSYGSRAEIVSACRGVAEAVRQGRLDPAGIDETTFARFLSTEGMPDPDLVIRTSGEQRLSNFLLWQSAYTELVFQDVLWPDYGDEHFAAALAEYARRERRFGARPG